MKKLVPFIVLILFLCAISLPVSAESGKNVLYKFLDGEYGIRIPDSFFVIHENITEEELQETGTGPDDALRLLEDMSVSLYALFENKCRALYIDVFEDAVSDGAPYEGLDDAKQLMRTWTIKLKDLNYPILFYEPYITDDDCFGKVAFTYEDDGITVYELDYVTAIENDFIVLSFISYIGQFDIEDNYLFDTIASTLHGSK